MGYDPGEAPDEFLQAVMAAATPYGDDAVHEMAAACGDDTIAQIEVLAEETRLKSSRVRVSASDVLRRRITEEIDRSSPPWERARIAARIAREVWNLEGPLPTPVLSELFELSASEFAEGSARRAAQWSAAFRDDNDPTSMLVSWNTRSPAGRRFLLARLVADHLASRVEEVLLPATRVITSRQQFQRAFAQEFLCPYHSLSETIDTDGPDEDDIEYAADQLRRLDLGGRVHSGQQPCAASGGTRRLGRKPGGVRPVRQAGAGVQRPAPPRSGPPGARSMRPW